jgi:hypothetical protein
LIFLGDFVEPAPATNYTSQLAHDTLGIMAYRFRQLVPQRPELKNFERWYAAIGARPAFAEHVSSIPLQ